jgi:PAS domain S-box-containing protein
MPNRMFEAEDAEILLSSLLMELEDIGLITWNGEGRITSLSESCRRLMQLPGSAKVGGPVSLLWQSPCHDFMQAFESFSEQAQNGALERELQLSRDGEAYWLRLKVRPCPESCGEQSAYMLLVRDISHKRRVMQAAERSFDLFDAAFRCMPDAAILVDPARRVLKASQGVERVFGYQEEELVGESLRILHADDDAFRQQLEAAESTATLQSPVPQVASFRHKQGELFQAETLQGPLYDRHGTLLGHICILRDITDRLNLESDLLEQTEMLESIFRQLPFALGVIDTNRHFVQMSDAALALFGYRQEAMVGQSTRMIYASDEAFEKAGDQLYVVKPLAPIVADLKTRSGKGFKGRMQLSPFYDATHRLKGYLIAIEDVSEQIAHIEVLRRYERMVSASSDALVFLDRDHVYQAVNEAYLKLWGKQRHEVIGHHIEEVVGEAFYNRITAPALARCFQGESVNIPLTQVTYPSGTFYMESTHNPYQDEDGSISGVQITLRNVTQRHLAEQAVIEREQRFQQAGAFAEFAVWELDVASGQPVEDKMLRRLLGYDSTDQLDSLETWLSLVPEPDHQMMTAAFARMLESPEGIVRLECKARRKAGDLVHIETLVQEIEKAGQRRLVGISRDITRLVEEREGLRQYELMTQATEDGLALIDRQQIYLAVNHLYLDVYGLAREEIVGKSVRELLGETAYHGTVKTMLDTALAGQDVHYESWFDYAQKGRRRMEITYSPYRDEAGEVTGLLVTSHDITDRYLAEHALQESEAKFRAIFEHAPVGVGILDETDGHVIDINTDGAQMLGYERDEIMHLKPWDVTEGLTPEEFLSRWQKMRQKGRVRFESTHIKKDGTRIQVLIHANSMTLQGRPVQLMTVVDISHQKQLEARLREQEEQYRSLVESTGAILFSADPETFEFTFVSQEAESLLGYPLQRWTEEPDFWVSHMHPEDRSWAPAFCKESTRKQQDHSFDYRMLAADGHIVWLHDVTSVVMDEERVSSLVGVMVDISDHKRAEEERRRLAEIVEQTADAILLTDTEFHITYINEAFHRLYGYTPAELHGQKPEILNAEENAQEIHPQIYAALQAGERVYRELLNRRKDGSLFTCQHSISPLRNAAGEIIAYMSSQRDVSQRVAAERGLRLSEERWQFALEGAGEGVWDWNIETSQVFFSRRWKAMLGYGEAEIGNRFDEWERRMHPDDLPDVNQRLKNYLSGEIPDYLSEFRMLCKGGGYKWILARGEVREWTPQGKPLRMIGTHQDITQRKDAENALRKSEERYRQIVETAQEGIWVIDDHAMTTFVNPSMARMLGYAEEEMPGRPLFDFMDEAARQQVELQLEERRQGISAVHDFRFRHKSGRDVWTSVSTNPLFDETGAYIGAMAMIDDISEARSLQDALISVQKMEAVGQLTGGIAHDFNNILGSILGFTELAQDRFGAQHDKLREYLRQIETAGGRARDLIRQLMIFSRGENTQAATSVPLTPLVQEIVRMLVPMLPAMVEIRTELPTTSPHVTIDPLHVQQILMNLCINARDAIDGAGVITISLTTRRIENEHCSICNQPLQGEWVSLRVSDTGRGIPTELQGEIFQPFVTSKGVGEGSGMGLAVVRGILRSYQAHLLVMSMPGRGASFEILLSPSQSGRMALEATQGTNKTTLSLQGRSILVVDDEPQILAYFDALFSELGAEVVCCGNGAQALGRFVQAAGKFDLVVSDEVMPGMNGSELAQQLRALGSEVPIILCSGYSERQSEVLAQALKIVAQLQKPVSKAALLALIEPLFSTRRADSEGPED